MFELFVSKNLSGVPVKGGGGGTPKNSWWKFAATWFAKSSPYFRPNNIIFHTRFQNWPVGRNYVIIDLSTNKKILRIQFGNVHTLP